MTLTELAALSECSVATIKYYIREGLLPAGDLVGTKRAEYSEAHVARLRMIRVLRDIGGLSITQVRAVVDELEDNSSTFHERSGSSFHALGPEIELPDTEAARTARLDVLEYVRETGWLVADDAPAIDLLTEVLLAVRMFWHPQAGTEIFNRYRDAMDDISVGDLAMIPDPPDMATFIAQGAVGTVLWDRALIALRRLALEDKSRRRFAEGD